MEILIKNVSFSVSLSLTALRIIGFWAPKNLKGAEKLLYDFYGFISFMFLLGTYLIIQIVDLYLIWGNLPAMTATAFLLFTNFAHSTKIFNIYVRRKIIQAVIDDSDTVLSEEKSFEGQKIVKSCDRESRRQQLLFFILTFLTVLGWASSAEKNKLPLQAWYPYNTSKSPAYEMTYLHQVLALSLAAFLNVSKDTLVTTLIAQCRCRLRLVGLSLRNLCNVLHPIGRETSIRISLFPSPKTFMLTEDQEIIVRQRLRCCVIQHQNTLDAAAQLQKCFSEPTFVQLTVSLVIICVTAFQLTAQTSNPIRLISMGTYLLNMMFQVFIYCYQGNQLSVESEEVAGAAYEFPWYACSVPIRRTIITLMRRCRRITKLTAGGFTTLSLASFMAIIKTSYSLFTLLQQVDSRN
ncbi:odorant receptor 43a-like [Maniola hyperantus]|uniref:odorant receptor 43a-like n=1 Tax=Aphantopus hyperantus TaxID=2795564 RepID=UPI00374907C4